MEAREKPILGMFEHMHHHLMTWFAAHCQIDADVPHGQLMLSTAIKTIQQITSWQAPHYRLLPFSETEFEVFSMETNATNTVYMF